MRGAARIVEVTEVLRIDPKFSWERRIKGLPNSQSLKDRLADAFRKLGLMRVKGASNKLPLHLFKPISVRNR